MNTYFQKDIEFSLDVVFFGITSKLPTAKTQQNIR